MKTLDTSVIKKKFACRTPQKTANGGIYHQTASAAKRTSFVTTSAQDFSEPEANITQRRSKS